jgi:hypothetical protein
MSAMKTCADSSSHSHRSRSSLVLLRLAHYGDPDGGRR